MLSTLIMELYEFIRANWNDDRHYSHQSKEKNILITFNKLRFYSIINIIVFRFSLICYPITYILFFEYESSFISISFSWYLSGFRSRTIRLYFIEDVFELDVNNTSAVNDHTNEYILYWYIWYLLGIKRI